MRSRSIPTRALAAFGLALLLPGLAPGGPPAARPVAAASATPGFARTGGAATAVAIEGTIAFAGVGASLQGLDIADPLRPALLGAGLPMPELVEGLALADGHLYAATRESEGRGGARLWTFDLADPRQPQPIGPGLTLPVREVAALAAGLGMLVLASETDILVFDAKAAASPRLIARFPTGLPGGRRRGEAAIAIDPQGFAWVARPWGLFTVNLADPSPAGVTEQQPLATRALAILDRQVYALTESGALEIWPVGRQDRAPVVLASLATAPRALAAHDGRLFLLDQAGRRLRAFAATTPNELVLREEVWIANQASERAALAAAGGRLVAALERGGLVSAAAQGIADQGRPADAIAPPIVHAHLSGARAFASADTAGFWVLDLADPALPRVAGALQVLAGSGGAGDWFVSDPRQADPDAADPARRSVAFRSAIAVGGIAFACSAADGLFAIEVARPDDLRVVGHLPAAPPCYPGTELAAYAGHLYLTTEDRRLAVVDIADPSAMRPIALEGAGGIGNITTLALEDGFLFATGYAAITSGALHVMDLSDPGRPRRVAGMDFNQAYAKLAVAHRRAFLSGSFGSVAIVDFSPPDRLLQRPTYSGIVAGRIGRYDTLAYAAGPSHLDTFLSSSSGQLFPLGRMALPWAGEDWIGESDVSVAGGRVTILRGRAGLFAGTGPDGILDPSAEDPAPNPPAPPSPPPPADPARPPGSTPTPAGGACLGPARAVLVADSSADMAAALGAGGNADSPGLTPAIHAFLAAAEPGGLEIGLGRFDDQGELLTLGSDPVQLREAWPPGEGFDSRPAARPDLGLDLAQQALLADRDPALPRRDTVILLAAGAPDARARGLAQARASALAGAGVTLFTVALGPRADTDFLAGLADRPEHAHAAAGPADLTALLERLGRAAGGCGPARNRD